MTIIITLRGLYFIIISFVFYRFEYFHTIIIVDNNDIQNCINIRM